MIEEFDFAEAYNRMLKGEKVRRIGWKGYWYINGVTGRLTIHTAEGKEIVSGNFTLTVMNTVADDWTVIYD